MIPRYLAGLDTVAANVVSSVNALHLTGHGLDAINDVNLNFFDPAGHDGSNDGRVERRCRLTVETGVGGAAAGDLDATIGHALGALTASTDGARRDLPGVCRSDGRGGAVGEHPLRARRTQ